MVAAGRLDPRLREDGKELVVIANEFFDALPVVRFKIDKGIKEIYVKELEGKLEEITHEPRAEIIKFYQDLNARGIYLKDGYTSEVCLHYQEIAQALGKIIKKGLLLIIDYGYPAQEYYQVMRHQGTIQIYSEHQANNNYLDEPGDVDITAHVDFSHLAQTLIDSDFQFECFTYQNVFLLEQGINANIENLSVSEQQKIKRLLDPALMGENFKVMIMSKNKELMYAPSHSLARFL